MDIPAEQWPAQPTCHGGAPFTSTVEPGWQLRAGRRHCAYCGSLHPADLLALLAGGARLGGSDWKYGYPHKFYVHHGAAMLKFYTDHLLDAGYGAEAEAALLAALTAHSGITWRREPERGIVYAAPSHGYQR